MIMVASLPNLDPIPLPAPVWLLTALLLLTFLLHAVPMMVTLGGGFWAMVTAAQARDPALASLARRIAKPLPYWTAAAVTTGVAALLFLQVLYGPVFYASTVVMAWPWLAIVGLVLIGYYGCYFRSYRLEANPRAAFLVGGTAWLAFTVVAFLYVNEMTLMLHPERLPALYAASRRGNVLNLAEPTLWPRYLHMLSGAVAGAALWIAWLGRRMANEQGVRIRSFGVRGFLWAMAAVALTGAWFLAALPADVGHAFAGGAAVPSAWLVLAVLMSIVAAWWAWAAGPQGAAGRTLPGATGASLGVLIVMVLIRHEVRIRTLGAAARLEEVRVAPQWLVIAIFAVLLVLGLLTVGWMMVASRGTSAVARATQAGAAPRVP